MTKESNDPLRKITGTISGLSKSRRNRDFVLSQMGKDVGASAVSAGLANMGARGSPSPRWTLRKQRIS